VPAPAAVDLGSLTPTMPDAWGTAAFGVEMLHSSAFHGFHGGEYWMVQSYIYHDTGHPYYESNFQLPSGAAFYGYSACKYDNSATEEFNLWIWDYFHSGFAAPTQTELASFATGIAAITGYTCAYTAFASPVTIVNAEVSGMHNYTVRVKLSNTNGDNNISFGGIALWYKLQVSPAPAVATFADVPVGAFGFQHIEALAASGITGGCGGGNFCPNDPLTRAQMAVFLAKAFGLFWNY
jgi:hypothetical protein